MILPPSTVHTPSFDAQSEANLHWFKVRVDMTVRHILLRHDAILPTCLADELHYKVKHD